MSALAQQQAVRRAEAGNELDTRKNRQQATGWSPRAIAPLTFMTEKNTINHGSCGCPASRAPDKVTKRVLLVRSERLCRSPSPQGHLNALWVPTS